MNLRYALDSSPSGGRAQWYTTGLFAALGAIGLLIGWGGANLRGAQRSGVKTMIFIALIAIVGSVIGAVFRLGAGWSLLGQSGREQASIQAAPSPYPRVTAFPTRADYTHDRYPNPAFTPTRSGRSAGSSVRVQVPPQTQDDSVKPTRRTEEPDRRMAGAPRPPCQRHLDAALPQPHMGTSNNRVHQLQGCESLLLYIGGAGAFRLEDPHWMSFTPSGGWARFGKLGTPEPLLCTAPVGTGPVSLWLDRAQLERAGSAP